MAGKANLQAAVQLLNAGRHGEALRMGKLLLKSQPTSPVVLSFCGTCAVHLGDLPAAQKYFSRLVKQVPDDADHWSNLAYAYFAAGDLKRAGHAYSQAAKLQPQNAEHALNVAFCAAKCGDLQAASRVFSEVLAREPDHPRALQGVANVLREQGRPFEAMPYMKRLAEITRARDPAFWVEYGELAFATMDLPETRRAIGNATSVGIGNPDLEARIAHLWSRMGNTEEALASVARALEMAPDDTEVLNDAAVIHIDAGDLAGAATFYEAILRIRPEIANGYYGLSKLRTFQRDSEDDAALLARMQAALELDLEDPAMLHFALGKAFDDLGEADRAFHHFLVANDLRKRERPYSLEEERQRAERMRRLFPVGSVDRTPAPIPEDALSPIFIVGMPRTGTTLVEQMVGAHPEVAPCGELMLMPNILASALGDDATPSPEGWREIGELYRKHLAGLAGDRRRATDKLPFNLFNVGAIWSALPDARVILMRRDPVDVALSCYQTPFDQGLYFSHDLRSIGQVQRLCDDLCDHWRTVAPERLLEVQYEDLVRDPEAGTRRILAHCSLDWHPDCARFYEKRRRVATASFNQVNRPVYTSSVERWRRYEAHLGPLFEALR